MAPNETIELLDAKQVKKILRCSLDHVYKMAEQGRIPCVRWECPCEGGKKQRTMVRFKMQDVMAFIDRNYRVKGRLRT